MNDDGRTDGDLLADASRGDDFAFGLLVRRYIRAATLLGAQLLGDRDEAEDIVQEAFTVVHRKASTFDSTLPFSPWLFAIVRRLAFNRKSRDLRRQRLSRLFGPRSIVDPKSVHAEETNLAHVDAERAQRLLDELSPMQRACFELVAVRDMTTQMVAEMHGISESTVRQHVFRARTALRAMLEQSRTTNSNDDGS